MEYKITISYCAHLWLEHLNRLSMNMCQLTALQQHQKISRIFNRKEMENKALIIRLMCLSIHNAYKECDQVHQAQTICCHLYCFVVPCAFLIWLHHRNDIWTKRHIWIHRLMPHFFFFASLSTGHRHSHSECVCPMHSMLSTKADCRWRCNNNNEKSRANFNDCFWGKTTIC